jgi:hypothetical protein
MHGVSKIVLQWYSKYHCAASVTKTFTVKGARHSAPWTTDILCAFKCKRFRNIATYIWNTIVKLFLKHLAFLVIVQHLSTCYLCPACPKICGTAAQQMYSTQNYTSWTLKATRGTVVCWDYMLEAGKSRILFPIRSLNLSTDLFLLADLWPRSRLSLK